MEIINATDGYKLGHHRMYPKVETVFEDGILKKEYSLEEIRQRIDNGL